MLTIVYEYKNMDIYEERELGEILGISIGTAVALEKAVCIDTPMVDHLYINLRTIFRNYLGSFKDPRFTNKVKLFKKIIEEVEVILGLCKDLKSTTLYVCDIPSDNPRPFKGYFNIKEPKTVNQKEYQSLETSFLSYVKEEEPFEFKEFTYKLRGDEKASVTLLTHVSLDLLSNYSFGSLTLLESHTGALKHPIEWYTKLTGGINNKSKVFNLLTLAVYGDKSKYFHAQKAGIRKSLDMIAMDNRWNPNTSKLKIVANVRKAEIPWEHKYLFLDILNEVTLK